MSTEHPDLPIEQEHINRAAAALTTMQKSERADAGRPATGGSMRMVERALRELAGSRLERLLGAEAGICFGRIYAQDGRDWHIGLHRITDGDETLVISFESKLGDKFAAATADDPQGLRCRRRLTLADTTRLVSIRDEMLDGSDPRPGYIDDAILEALEADRSGEMHHIAATIERQQNRLIRFDRSGVLVVQGGPGTGKTAVALHRASWLAYTFAASLGDTGGILVVGPNPTFMSFIESVLPGLKRHVAQMDVERLAPVRGRSDEPREMARLKGDARMARVLRQAAFSRVHPPEADIVIRVGGRQVTLPHAEVADAVRRSRGRRPTYMEGREDFRRRAGELLLTRLRSSGDADTALAMLRRQSGPWFNFIQRVWPAISAEQLLHEIYTIDRRRRHGADRVLSDTEVGLLARPGAKGPGDQRWTRADAVLLDEAEYVLRGRTGGWRYVIVDEAQDLNPMQLRMVGRRSSTGDMTLVGDLGQATGTHRYGDWHEILGHIASKKAASIEELARGYRVPQEIVEYASQLLPAIAPGLAPTQGLRPADGFWVTSTADAPAAAAGDIAEVVESETGTVGVIAARSMVRDLRKNLDDAGIEYGTGQKSLTTRVSVLAAADAKGLEFDHVIVVEPAAIAAGSEQGLAELYVALTRPTRSLSVWHHDPLPSELR